MHKTIQTKSNQSNMQTLNKHSMHYNVTQCMIQRLYEPHREKTGFLLMRKQRRRSASR